MAATRPSPATDSGSSRSGKWWDAKEFRSIRESAARSRATGDLAGLETVAQTGLTLAQRLGNRKAQIGYLTAIGNSRLQRFQYGSALEAYLRASHLAEETHDREDFGAIAGNLSSVYQQVGDLPSALSAAERGRAAIWSLPQQPFYKAQLLLQLGRLHRELQDGTAEGLFLEGIDAARQQDDQTLEKHSWDVATEAQAWDLLGRERLSSGKLAAAETAISESLRLRTLFESKDLAFSYWHLGELRLEQARNLDGSARTPALRTAVLKDAERFTQSALEAVESGGYGPAKYVLLNQRGRVREELGSVRAALEDLGAAVDTAARWRLAVPTAGSSLTAANVELDRKVFDLFVDGAARESLRTGSAILAAQSFLAQEMNRAASLRETKDLAAAWHSKLPSAFWETLGKLRAAQTRSEAANAGGEAEVRRLSLELTEMEALAGIGVPQKIPESFRSDSSLILIQRGLGGSELLLSFHLGERESYVWAITRSSLSLYRLPSEALIQSGIAAFRSAVVGDEPDAEIVGQRLYRDLFGKLAPAEAEKKSWLLSLDGPLFELPFSALVLGRRDGKAVYVVERHSLQVVPSALLLSRGSGQPAGRFLAVGDPIYNFADSRSSPARQAPPRDNLGQLTRLVASRHEVDQSRRNWDGNVQVLEGAAATKTAFMQAVSRTPTVIHLATHVLAKPSQRDQAFLAFSLNADGRPELLGTADVAMLHVPGAVVVMTGCASGSGTILPGAGLLGLSRAWLTAGASAVVATGWPVADARGDLLPAFYNHLKDQPPAEALRKSQVEMLASGTWQAAPSYWASFQVSGGAR